MSVHAEQLDQQWQTLEQYREKLFQMLNSARMLLKAGKVEEATQIFKEYQEKKKGITASP